MTLTKREKEIIKLRKMGYKYREIAEMLFISFKTVCKHLENARLKNAYNN